MFLDILLFAAVIAIVYFYLMLHDHKTLNQMHHIVEEHQVKQIKMLKEKLAKIEKENEELKSFFNSFHVDTH